MNAQITVTPLPSMREQIEALVAACEKKRHSGALVPASPEVMGARVRWLLALLSDGPPQTTQALAKALAEQACGRDPRQTDVQRVKGWVRTTLHRSERDALVRICGTGKKKGDRGYLFAVTPAGLAMLKETPAQQRNPFEIGFIPDEKKGA